MPASPGHGAGNVALGGAKGSADHAHRPDRTVTAFDLMRLERILHNYFLAAEDTQNDEHAKDRRWCAKKM